MSTHDLPSDCKASNGLYACIAHGLNFGAAPCFMLMAWIAASGTSALAICATTSPIRPINDMAWMYLLMGIFHLSPWLHLIGHRTPANGVAHH